MVRIYGGSPPAESDFRAADALSLRAIRRERAMLLSARPVDLDELRDRFARQAVRRHSRERRAREGSRLGPSGDATQSERRSRSVWLGLQIADDVVDWEDDLQRGGAWAVCLMRGHEGRASSLRAKESIRTQVLQSGVSP